MRYWIASAALFALFPSFWGGPETVSTESGEVTVESLADLDHPWGMAFLSDGRLLITEKPGRLRIYDAQKDELSDPIQGVPEVEFHGQGGLLDVAVAPVASSAGKEQIFLSYSERAKPQPSATSNLGDPRLGQGFDEDDDVLKGLAVARGWLDGDQLVGAKVIWRQDPKTIGRGHFGGRLLFTPDGLLLITSGERQRFEPAQNPKSSLGKIIRINPDGTVPSDNPFVGALSARADLWSFGHRNVLGLAIHPDTGKLWIDEMGPKGGDEINIVAPGQNYGWPLVSDGDHYDGTPIPRHATRPDLAPPIFSWNPSVSPSGLIFYTGSRFPAWQGNALLGGLSSEALIRLSLAGEKVVGTEVIGMGRRIRDVSQAPDGAVLLLSDGGNGELLRLTPATDTNR
jgi:glucose/arabinose dehydrogenase